MSANQRTGGSTRGGCGSLLASRRSRHSIRRRISRAAPRATARSRKLGTAGDVNNDGYDDVIVGAPTYDNGETNEGRAYLYQGSNAGLGSSPNWIAESNQIGAHLGRSVGAAGDVNGDGYADVVAGASPAGEPLLPVLADRRS